MKVGGAGLAVGGVETPPAYAEGTVYVPVVNQAWVDLFTEAIGPNDIDPNRLAVGGFSAGAVISYSTAYQWDQIGTTSYFPGDPHTKLGSRPQAAIGASGFLPTADGLAPTTMASPDAPTSFIASRFDQAADYRSTALTTRTARSNGLTAELTSYCTEGLHAEKLYSAHQAATDLQWTTFLARELFLYGNEPAPTAEPICAGV